MDYWSVDFNMESRKEIVRVKKDVKGSPSAGSGQISSLEDCEEEIWTGGYIFENEWQSFQ